MILQWFTRQVESMEAQADIEPSSGKPGGAEDVETISEEAMMAQMGLEVKTHRQGS